MSKYFKIMAYIVGALSSTSSASSHEPKIEAMNIVVDMDVATETECTPSNNAPSCISTLFGGSDGDIVKLSLIFLPKLDQTGASDFTAISFFSKKKKVTSFCENNFDASGTLNFDIQKISADNHHFLQIATLPEDQNPFSSVYCGYHSSRPEALFVSGYYVVRSYESIATASSLRLYPVRPF